jgi:putative membrane protein
MESRTPGGRRDEDEKQGQAAGTAGSRAMEEDPAGRETSGDRLVYFAAERTLLSWVRVGLGLMALGFVVDRFGLFLREMELRNPKNWATDPFSSWIGILLVTVGIAANVAAAIRYMGFEIRYHRDRDTRPGHGLTLGIFLTVITSGLGIIIVLLLMLTAH